MVPTLHFSVTGLLGVAFLAFAQEKTTLRITKKEKPFKNLSSPPPFQGLPQGMEGEGAPPMGATARASPPSGIAG